MTEFRTRRPTGRPPFPMVLLAGGEKCGKSYAAAAFSASPMVDRTFWFELGEGAADQYGAIPGARYEIVEHDGTYSNIVAAIEWAMKQPRTNGKPHAFAFDSTTELWDLLTEEAQATANRRAAAKAAKANRAAPTEDVQITMDLWNAAKKRWRKVIDLLRTYDGPVFLTARLELVTVMGENGAPTTAKDWKIRAEKNLPYECDVIVRMPAPGVAELTGVRSLHVQVPPGGVLPMPEFTLEQLLTRMGLAAEDATAPRSYTAPTAEPLDVEPERQAQRERGQSEDEWATPGPAMATPAQLDDLAFGLRVVRGVASRETWVTAVSGLVGDEVNSPQELTQEAAERALAALRQEDARNAKERQQDEREAARAAEAAASAVADQQEVDWILGGLTAVRGITDPQSKRVAIEYMIGAEVPDPYRMTAEQAASVRATLEAEYAAAQQPGPAPAAKPEEKRKRALHAAFKKAGIEDHTERVAYAGLVVGHAVASTNDLTAAEVEQVIEALVAGRTLADFNISGRGRQLASMIADATTSDELAEVSERFWQAHEASEITRVEVDVLISASGRREQQLAQTTRAAA